MVVPTTIRLLALIGLVFGIYVVYGVGSKSGKSKRQILEDLQKQINEAIDKEKSKLEGE